MEKLLKNKIINLYKDFLDLSSITKIKNEDIQKYKKELNLDFNLKENVEKFSNMVADFTLMSRDAQIIFTELFNIVKLYRDLNLEALPEDIIEFYSKNEIYFPKTLFVIKEDGLVEKEEGSLQRERDKFMKSDYLKNLINTKN